MEFGIKLVIYPQNGHRLKRLLTSHKDGTSPQLELSTQFGIHLSRFVTNAHLVKD